jgi:hypothetical protein
MFEEVSEPNLAGADAGEAGQGGSAMGHLVASLLGQKNKKED